MKRGVRAYALGAPGVLKLHCCRCARLLRVVSSSRGSVDKRGCVRTRWSMIAGDGLAAVPVGCFLYGAGGRSGFTTLAWGGMVFAVSVGVSSSGDALVVRVAVGSSLWVEVGVLRPVVWGS